MTAITTPPDRVVLSREMVTGVPLSGYYGQLTTTGNTTVYTAPALADHPNDPTAARIATVIMNALILSNSDSSAQTVTGHLVESGGSVAANRLILPTVSIPANTMIVVEFGAKGCPLGSGEFLNLVAGVANTISYRVHVELMPQ